MLAALALVGLLPGLISCSSSAPLLKPSTPAGNTPASQWVVAWGAPPETALPSAANPGGSEQSYRFLLLPTVGGTQERVHLSNVFGSTPITVGSARLSLASGQTAAIDAAHDQPLTFDGASSVTIQPGQEAVSDSVNVSFSFGQRLAVSVYLKGTFPALTQHDSQVTTNFATSAGSGDQTTDTSGAAFATPITEWFLLSGVDVYGSYQGTVAIFGSSSVDGHASDYGDTNSYPTPNVAVAGQDNDRPSDWLARQLAAAGYNMGVLNAGTIGDPVLEDARTAAGASVAGVDRMQRDVLSQPGIKAVIIYFGGVDLRGDCNSATNVEAGLTNLVSQAKAAGVRVILGTIPPSEYCITTPGLVPTAGNPYLGDINPGPENPGSTQRNLVNAWIRTSGAQLPGVVDIADFDKALADPAHPDFMLPNLNSGDNFHPNGAGYGVQTSAIPLSSILGAQ